MEVLLVLWFIIILIITKWRLPSLYFILPILLGVWISFWVTLVLFWVIIIVFLVLPIKNKSESEGQIKYQNTRGNKSNNRWANIYNMQLPELFEKYKENSLVPPLNSLVPRSYEKWEITSWKFSFDNLSEKDKKTILRIAINIWNKRKKDLENQKNIEEKYKQ
jgi:ABC-type multidrug transport system fused ATPase/permease subunit